MLLRDFFLYDAIENTVNQNTIKLLYMRRYCTLPSCAYFIDCVGHCIFYGMAKIVMLRSLVLCRGTSHLSLVFFSVYTLTWRFLCVSRKYKRLVEYCITSKWWLSVILRDILLDYRWSFFFPHPGKGSNDTKTQRRSPWENETAERSIRPLKPTNKKRTAHNG